MTAQRPVAAVVYLDVDDEITSAASRIRSVAERRIAIVLPGGSRVSTSRINFRLLAREADTRGRHLSIIAPEASARALAAAAGLPAFASVAEYEAALEHEGAEPTPEEEGAPGPTANDGGEQAAAAAGGAAGEARPADDRPGQLRGWWADDGMGPTPRQSRASIRGPHTPGGAIWPRAGSSVRGPAAAGGSAPMAAGPGAATGGVRPRTSITDTVVLPLPEVHPEARRRRVSGLVLGLVSVLIVFVVVGGVAGWLFLPTATITVAARVDPVGPLQFTVRADPLQVNEDVQQGIVPAEVVTFDLAVSQDFAATGKKVSETRATGAVQWTNCDPTRAYTIPAGTIARTGTGEQFATGDAVFLPVAILSGNPPTITCQSRSVAVTAKASGTEGNVEAGTITGVPSDYNSVVIRVTNPNATTGGTHTESKIVAQKDVDGAMTTLTKAIRDQFTAETADPAQAPSGLTLFAATRSMSGADPTIDPDTLVGTVMPSFTLGLTASGTATAVDPARVQSLGDRRVRAAVAPDKSLVRDSVAVNLGQPRVDGSAVLFPVTAQAEEVNAPDATTIRRMVKGLAVDDARERLRDYGDATVVVWPGWVTTITTYDFRLDVRVISGVPTEPTSPVPSLVPSAATTATPARSTAPSGVRSSAAPATPASSGVSSSGKPRSSGSPAPSGTAAPSGT